MKSIPQYILVRLNSKCIELLHTYESPLTESSIAKGIPATAENLETIKQLNRVMPLIRRYRGPRRKGRFGVTHQGQSMCLKADATSVALYLRDDTPASVFEQLRAAGVFHKSSTHPQKRVGETWRQYADRIGVVTY